MKNMKDSFYSDRNEYRKDNTPSTSLFVWLVPAFVIVAMLCRVDAVTEPRRQPLFDLQDSAFVCVLGVCL